jgi:ribonuclease HII
VVYSSGKILIQGINVHLISRELLQKLNLSEEIVLGIDESGRGEDFGMFTVAAVLGDKNKLRGLRDSKKIKNIKMKKGVVTKNALAYAVVAFSPEFVDECRMKGLTMDELQCKAVKSFSDLFNFKKDLKIAVDGKPLNYCPANAEYVIKGDDINPAIGAASVLAKFAREQSKNRSKRLSWGKIKSKN